jgi:hypothetical protein
MCSPHFALTLLFRLSNRFTSMFNLIRNVKYLSMMRLSVRVSGRQQPQVTPFKYKIQYYIYILTQTVLLDHPVIHF